MQLDDYRARLTGVQSAALTYRLEVIRDTLFDGELPSEGLTEAVEDFLALGAEGRNKVLNDMRTTDTMYNAVLRRGGEGYAEAVMTVADILEPGMTSETSKDEALMTLQERLDQYMDSE